MIGIVEEFSKKTGRGIIKIKGIRVPMKREDICNVKELIKGQIVRFNLCFGELGPIAKQIIAL